MFALQYDNDPLVPAIRDALQRYVGFCVSTADNPFGISKVSVGKQEYFFRPITRGVVGDNWMYLTRVWAAALAYRVTGEPQALQFATDQMDWILGKNPYGLCQFEGEGSYNPHWYHHRYASIPGKERGAVPGAIPNGFMPSVWGLDQPGFDMSYPNTGQRNRVSYRTSEPFLVENMCYLLALSALSPAK